MELLKSMVGCWLLYFGLGLIVKEVGSSAPKQHQSEKQWIYMPAYGWDRQFSSGVWDYFETVPVERMRMATIGNVITRMYGSPANASILDVGCAEGLLSDYLTPEQKKNYIGMDISKVAIHRAEKHRGPPMQWVIGITHQYTPPKFLDFIVFAEVLYYVDHEKILKQYENYLTENGKIIVSLVLKANDNNEHNEKILNFSRNHFQVADKFELGGNARDRWVTFKIDVYEKKKSG
jgi:2-polyprenyl-3-methyl-5-hydroxy-6-metoxy-1,4-benzoquinol methylase